MKIIVKYVEGEKGVVRADELQELIQEKRIVAFRRSDDDWVKLGVDTIRGEGSRKKYKGPERRNNVLFY